MKETGGTHTYTKQYEVSPEEAKKMMDEAMAAGAKPGKVEAVTEDEL